MTSLNRTQRTRTALGALAATALLTLSACGGSSDDDAKAGASDSPTADASGSSDADGGAGAAAPDLSDVPDVVAEVNGEEITKDEFSPIYEASFQQATAQSATTGQDVDEAALQKQTVDDLVDTELLAQEADSRGIEVTDQDVDDELTSLAEQNGMESGDALLDAVAQQGMDEATARSQIETQVLVEKLVTDEEGEIAPTEKELRTLYDQAKQQQAQSGQEGSFPSFADAHDQVEEQAKAQEISKVAGALVKSLRKDADISVNL
ncbi:peptidyl-prolyl cis-trans isomerase SurA [Nocardioides exalbidus]|uniref:Peptidyl-prolyl cis-trans isomerase SurA n=1 Tax=Nocardioides exalbidus TaxID=402596 RepID=A0A1H4R3Z6_9ACTN|nr:SurA N-terminal domain-containing protein [Nocardioides exalbidus]SEC26649.1 peptidyl-prolyl cis-trans isomerase SurA [Nocardioides exalbidus]